MTLGLARAFSEKKSQKISEENLLQKWEEEYHENKQKKGGIGRAGYGTIALVFEGIKSLATIKASQTSRKYPGTTFSPIDFFRGKSELQNFKRNDVVMLER